MLHAEHMPELYAILRSPVTPWDCGPLCAPTNGGHPLCCQGEKVVPVLYRGELAWLLERTGLWKTWRVRRPEDRSVRKDLHRDYRLGECRGAPWCEREHRSLNCRTFPFEPYIDHDGMLAGLVFDTAFTTHAGRPARHGLTCPLGERWDWILPAYVEESLRFWRRVFELDPSEYEHQRDLSREHRRRMAQHGAQVRVLLPGAVADYPTSRRELAQLRKRGPFPRIVPLPSPSASRPAAP